MKSVDVSEFAFSADEIEAALLVVMKLAENHDVYAVSVTPSEDGTYEARIDSDAMVGCVRTAITEVREALDTDRIRAERALDVLSPETMLASVRELGLDDYGVSA
jgi:iron only hydrogenase large subunit-like protein